MANNQLQTSITSLTNATRALKELMGPESNNEDRSHITTNFDSHFMSLIQDYRTFNPSTMKSNHSQSSIINQYNNNSTNGKELLFIGDFMDDKTVNGFKKISNNVGDIFNDSNINDEEDNYKLKDQEPKKNNSKYFTSVKNNKKKAQVNFHVVKKKHDDDTVVKENISENGKDMKEESERKENNEVESEEEEVDNKKETKKVNHDKKRLENNKNNNYSQSLEKDDLVNKPPQSSNANAVIPKENYLDQLIIAAEELLSKGIVTLEYLNSPTIDTNHTNNYSNTNSNNDKEPNLKCNNKLCRKIINSPNEVFHTTLTNNSKEISLCKKCFDASEKGDYCYYCNVIYREFEGNQGRKDNKGWIQCDYCSKWQHIQCEMQKGTYHDLTKLNNHRFKYMCPLCRNATQEKKSKGHKGIKKTDPFLGKKTKNEDNEGTNQKKKKQKNNDAEKEEKNEGKEKIDIDMIFKEIEEKEKEDMKKDKRKGGTDKRK